MALSIGFRDSVSFLLTIQATGFLTVALVGLPPTEYASLRWTHPHAGLSRRTCCRFNEVMKSRSAQARLLTQPQKQHSMTEIVLSAIGVVELSRQAHYSHTGQEVLRPADLRVAPVDPVRCEGVPF